MPGSNMTMTRRGGWRMKGMVEVQWRLRLKLRDWQGQLGLVQVELS